MIRPLKLMLGALAVAGAAKTGVALLDDTDAPRPPSDSMFLSAASAAGVVSETPEPPAGETPMPVAAETCETPEEMLRAIREERALLKAQKEKMAERESELELAGEKLKIDQGRLSDLKGEVEGLLGRVEQAQSADVDRLVALYSAMKPKEAAAIMNDLDIEVSVMVLGTMAERDAAPILAQLNPVRARAISRIIMERSKLPGDQRLDDIKL